MEEFKAELIRLDIAECNVATCKKEITEEEVTFYNCNNEEGEEYYEVTVECTCGHEILETSEWGNVSDKLEALQGLGVI